MGVEPVSPRSSTGRFQTEEAPLVVSMGDPAGLAADLLITLWRQHRDKLPPFALMGDPVWIVDRARALGLAASDLPVREIEGLDQTKAVFADALPMISIPLAVPAQPGQPDPRNGSAVAQAIVRAVDAVLAGEAAGVVTLPIAKAVMLESGFGFPGHTEYLGALAADRVPDPADPTMAGPAVMMLACPGLRVVPVTVHQPLREALSSLSTHAIITAGRITAAALRRDFGIAKPRLVVSGVNPHAGEQGRMGSEEHRIITPAVEALQAEGIEVSGPYPADTMFHAEARARYDAALCMYHDQALIPLKTLDFFGGVNVTLGLPFIRTSPDHGTAFPMAGQGRGNGQSLHAALLMAHEAAGHRRRVLEQRQAHAG